MINTRKEKLDLLKNILNGSTTIKDVNESSGALALREYWKTNEEPGIYYDHANQPYSLGQIQAILDTDKAKGVLSFYEVRTYQNKAQKRSHEAA